MPRRLRVRQNPIGSFLGGIISVVFVIIGVSEVIPNTGAFGIVWTLFALVGAVTSFYNAFSDEGIADKIIDVPDDAPNPAPQRTDAETRLCRLGDLKAKGLITVVEYEQRRNTILNGL